MKSGFLTILQKELRRFFTDKRMVITSILLPGVMIFAIYYFMGTALSSAFSTSEDYQPVAYSVAMPEDVAALAKQAGVSFTAASADDLEALKQQVAEKEADLIAVFPEGFHESIAEGEQADISLFYNSTRTESSSTYGKVSALLSAYKETLAPTFTVNAATGSGDLASAKDSAGFSFALLMPMLILIFLFSGCMGVSAESIAGEKERGTIATMLITPLKRWQLALGKIVSISCISLLAGLSSFIGTMAALPSMMGAGDADAALKGSSIYGFGDYALLLLVTLSTVLLFVGLLSVISALAKSVKEAGTLVTPLMILVMLVGVLGMFSSQAQTNLLMYLVPVYNSVQSMVGIFAFSGSLANVLITVAVNLAVTAVCVVALTRMFDSEKVLFSR